jgi:FkbM family methyltransferase
MDKTPQPSRIAEFIILNLTVPSGKGFVDRARRWLFTRIRHILATRTDLYARVALGGSEIFAPLGHDLPLLRALHSQYSANVGRLCRYIAESDPEMTIIDIGANIGDTAAIVREHCQNLILCIEPDPRYFPLLQANVQHAQLSNVHAVQTFIATYSGEIKGRLVSDAGSGHFAAAEDATLHARTLSDLLRDFPQFLRPRLIKIDTDGLDCSILRSELHWLRAVQPILFFEYDPFYFEAHAYDGTQIFEDLLSAGYAFVILYDNVGDYLTSLDLTHDRHILEDLQRYYEGRGGHQYFDVAVFPQKDYELACAIRVKEAGVSTGHAA